MQDHRTPKRFTLPLRVALGLLLAGALVKLQHWPFADALFILGVAGIVVLYPFRYVAKHPRTFLDHVKLGLAITWPIAGLLRVMHLPLADEVGLVASVLWVVWFFRSGPAGLWTDDEQRTPSVPSVTLFTLGLVLTIAGTLFRIQHWPYAMALLIAGLACCGLWAVVEFLLPRRSNDDGSGGT